MSSEVAIRTQQLSKCYQIYEKPQDRLKQFFMPRLQRLMGAAPKTYYRDFWALKGIDIEVRRGETVGIIGRNGSGKSTLLQMICGTLHPTAGHIETYGRIAALLELGSGFNPDFTGRENVFLNATVLGLNQQEIEQRYQDILDFADIGDFINQPIKTYSSGMLVRLSFAVIAHVDADILIVDEALAVGDAFFNQKCMNFLRNFMKTGTVLFVSHDTSSVRSLCNKAVWIHHGEIVEQGDPKTVCDSYLESLFESRQGKSEAPRAAADVPSITMESSRDHRQDFLNNSNLRNDIQLFAFDPEAASIGKRGAQIVSVEMLDMAGQSMQWVVGGEYLVLRIKAVSFEPLDSPILGFFIKDKLGQNLFGDNTYLSYIDQPVNASEGQHLVADFEFQMPRLAVGDYSVCVAIANGSDHEHVHHHWIHDALMFRSETSSVASGLLGIPIRRISLAVQ